MNHVIRGPCWCQGCQKKRAKGNDKKWAKWCQKASKPENKAWVEKAIMELAQAANSPLSEEEFRTQYPAEAAAMAARQEQPSQQPSDSESHDDPSTEARETTTSSAAEHPSEESSVETPRDDAR